MTISSSLSASVAGLNANATRLASISDNIANSGTYGYKRVVTEFSNMVTAANRGAGTYSAGGVRAGTARLVEERGDLIGTSKALDLAIAGRGMFPVMQEVELGSSGGGALYMTRTGSFSLDANGVLKTDTGLVLMGWPADTTGAIPSFPRDTMAGLQPIMINANQAVGNPTTQIGFGVNLPATMTVAGSTATPIGLSPTGIVAATWSPASITVTVSLVGLVT